MACLVRTFTPLRNNKCGGSIARSRLSHQRSYRWERVEGLCGAINKPSENTVRPTLQTTNSNTLLQIGDVFETSSSFCGVQRKELCILMHFEPCFQVPHPPQLGLDWASCGSIPSTASPSRTTRGWFPDTDPLAPTPELKESGTSPITFSGLKLDIIGFNLIYPLVSSNMACWKLTQKWFHSGGFPSTRIGSIISSWSIQSTRWFSSWVRISQNHIE